MGADWDGGGGVAGMEDVSFLAKSHRAPARWRAIRRERHPGKEFGAAHVCGCFRQAGSGQRDPGASIRQGNTHFDGLVMFRTFAKARWRQYVRARCQSHAGKMRKQSGYLSWAVFV